MERKYYIDPAEYTSRQIIEITLEQFSLANRGLNGIKKRIERIRNKALITGDVELINEIEKLLFEINAEERQTESKIKKFEAYKENGGHTQ